MPIQGGNRRDEPVGPTEARLFWRAVREHANRGRRRDRSSRNWTRSAAARGGGTSHNSQYVNPRQAGNAARSH